MGPITLFDKSFLEMLSLDQAALFDALYSANICPVFMTEVLADLSKVPPGQRSPEKIVGDLAAKSPAMHSYPNAEYSAVCLAELFGHEVEMRGVPAAAGGRMVERGGKLGMIYDDSDEQKAFTRWQAGEFRQLEREFARVWRHRMETADHRLLSGLVRSALGIEHQPKNETEAKVIAASSIDAAERQWPLIRVAMALLGLSGRVVGHVHRRWTEAGKPPLRQFAPYTAYCLEVELFFHICIDKKLISPDRPSNRVDVSYLFYLPFCQVFVSNDKLHRRVAPLFLEETQQFAFGEELKTDLSALDAYFEALPESERAEGLFRMASAPPPSDAYLTTRIWRAAGMRERPSPSRATTSSTSDAESVLAELRAMQTAGPADGSRREGMTMDDLDQVIIKRMVPRKMGKWNIFPPGFESAADDEGNPSSEDGHVP